MDNFYIIIAAVTAIILILILILIKKIFSKKKKSKKASKESIKKMQELKAKISADSNDYVSMYSLAKLEDEAGLDDEALNIYENLLKVSFLQDKEEIDVCKRLEKKYETEGKTEESFKYALKISKLDSNNMKYNIKIASILTKNGEYIIACDYFNKALLAKNEFNIENIKAAAFSFFKIKDYKKSAVFLEELYKRIEKENTDELLHIQKSLISMYMLADELNIARSFIEQIINDKKAYDKYYTDRIYLHILYKLIDNEKFKELYDKLYTAYKIKDSVKENYSILLDYCFYSYFFKDIELSKILFEKINDFNIEELKAYNINIILDYLSDIVKATSQINKLRSMMNLEHSKQDNYEKYVSKEDMENWERAVDLWEGSFIDIDYILSLIEIEKTINAEKIFNELKIDAKEQNNEMNLSKILKVDKIYNLNKIDFKKLCQNVIRNCLSYSIVQEYTDAVSESNYGDEVNYIAYHTRGNKKDLTLISFKRWKKVEIGELMIRDFLMMVNEAGAKNGILIVPVKLSNSAKSFVSHNDKITVYSRMQFNNLIKDENI
ncbi:restriction endonuclease [uncultured Brachyspira sp.]|uniref:tetratricopeptide repeat protein n=1 Tax=uncultured Brachyspira sp. TaxID=221953 RepID=UPI00260C67BF|nr:restriction endonuclease [uncultured Brachyspira sp.]